MPLHIMQVLFLSQLVTKFSSPVGFLADSKKEN